MFEPENDIERMLMRAATEPAARPAFARALMDAQIYVVFVSDKPPLVGPEGQFAVPPDAKLSLQAATRGEEKLIAFFTAPTRAREWFKGNHIVMPDKARDLFARHHNASFFLNPGSAYGKEFLPGEVKGLLNGHYGDEPESKTIQKEEQVLLAHPKEIPTDLIAGLARELGRLKSIRGAFLMLAMRSGKSEPSWMLGVDHDGSWEDVRAAIGRAIKDDVLGGWMLDAVSLHNSSLASTLRTGIPVIAAKRGFLQKLFK
jgi:SseB protein C-terminal domain/SseB protein N-terminal domain